jgi:hypothetical protein
VFVLESGILSVGGPDLISRFRDRIWVLQPSEFLASLLLFLYLILGLGAWFSYRMGAVGILSFAFLDLALWCVWIVYLLYRQPPPFGRLGFLRGVAPWLVLLLAYDLTGRLTAVVHPIRYDFSLRNLESGVWGGGASGWGRFLHEHPHGIDLFCLFYLALFFWIGGLLVYHLIARRFLYQRFLLGLIIVHVVGYVGYLFFPAEGPRYAFPQEWEWLSGGSLFAFTNAAVGALSTRSDVFPSLHGALSSYLLLWQWREDRGGLWWGAPLALGIWASTLLLGYHYLPDLVSGILLAVVAVWAAPRLERIMNHYRQRLDPPVTWLTELTQGGGHAYGKLAGRLSELLPLGGDVSPGIVFGKNFRHRGEEPLRTALAHMGEGPYWLRPSDASGSRKNALGSMKPLSREQVVRTVFLAAGRRCFVVQKARKVHAVGLCRALPSKDGRRGEVELSLTTLPGGQTRQLRLKPGRWLSGRLEGPWMYYPSEFPVRGFALREIVQTTRRLAEASRLLAEVEWFMSEGRIYLLDGGADRRTRNGF